MKTNRKTIAGKEIFDLVDLEERKYIAENCIMDIPEVRGMKIVDIDKATRYVLERRNKRKMSKIVQITPLYPNKVKDVNLSFTNIRDNRFNIYYGIFTELDPNKNPKFRRVRFENGFTFNLDDFESAKMWVVSRMHAKLAGSPNQMEDPIYYVEDPSIEASKNIIKAESMSRAFAIIDSFDGKEAVSIGRYMGIDMISSYSYKTIIGTLKQKAMENPTRFLEMYDNSNRQFVELVSTAIELDVIREEVGKGYFYEEILLGMSREEAVEKIRTDASLRQSVIAENRHRDETVRRINEEYNLIKTEKSGKSSIEDGDGEF